MDKYVPPYDITEEMLELTSEITEDLGRLSNVDDLERLPRLRRVNRIKSIQSSLAIENNTLSLEQVTDVINGKRVLGPQDDILAVKNAFAVYKMLPELDPFSLEDLKKHKADVEAAIAEINAQLEENGTISDDMKAELEKLTADLAEANSDIANVETLAKDNAEAIISIQTAISDLETLRANITSLQNLKADKEYVDAQIEAIKELIPTDYLTAEGVSAAIESALVNYVSLDFMTAYSTTVEMQNYVGTEIAAALATVDNKIAQAFVDNGYNKTDFEAVVAHMTSVNTALTDKGFVNFAALVDKVNDLSTNYATVATVTEIQKILNGDGTEENKGLVADVEGLLTWKTTTQSTIDTLKSDVAKLKEDVAKLQNMVKSLVYIPSLEDRTVRFESVQLKKGNGYETISKSTDQELLFRVSPASAAENLLDNYEIDLYDDGAVASRSGDNFVLDKESVKVVKDGVISVKVSALTYQSRAIALALTPKADAEGNKEEYDNITSDYIAAMCDVAKFEAVTFAFGATTGDQGKIENLKDTYDLYYNGTAEEKTVNLKDECKFYFTTGTGSNKKYYAVSDYKQLDASQFGVTFKYNAQNSDKITVNKETGVVTVKDGTETPVGPYTIQAFVSVGSYNTPSTAGIDLKINVATKGLKYEVALDAAEYEFSQVNKTSSAVVFNLSNAEKTRIAATAMLEDFSDITLTGSGNGISVPNTLKLPVLSWGNNNTVSTDNISVIANGTSGVKLSPITGAIKPGKYTLDYTISGTTTIAGVSTPIEIKVTKDITVKAPSVPMLSEYQSSAVWDGENVEFNLSYNNREMFVGVDSPLFSFSHEDPITSAIEYINQLTGNGGKVLVSLSTDYAEDEEGVIITGNDATINSVKVSVENEYFSYAKTAALTYKVISLTGETETFSANLVFNDIKGTWVVATGNNVTKNYEIAASELSRKSIFNGFTWKDEFGFNAWKDGETETSFDNNEYKVQCKVISSNVADLSKYIEVDADGNLVLGGSKYLDLAEGAQANGDQSITFRFRIVPVSVWGTPAGYNAANNEITVKITGITPAE